MCVHVCASVRVCIRLNVCVSERNCLCPVNKDGYIGGEEVGGGGWGGKEIEEYEREYVCT